MSFQQHVVMTPAADVGQPAASRLLDVFLHGTMNVDVSNRSGYKPRMRRADVCRHRTCSRQPAAWTPPPAASGASGSASRHLRPAAQAAGRRTLPAPAALPLSIIQGAWSAAKACWHSNCLASSCARASTGRSTQLPPSGCRLLLSRPVRITRLPSDRASRHSSASRCGAVQMSSSTSSSGPALPNATA